MKLSNIKGEAVFEVIADCIEPISNIASDETVSKLFKREVLLEGEDPRKHAIKRLSASIPTLMRDHKQDLVAIMAALSCQTVEEYSENMTIVTLIADVGELISDPVFMGFFNSAGSDPTE